MSAPLPNDTYNIYIAIENGGSTTNYYILSPTASGSILVLDSSADDEDDQIWADGADLTDTNLSSTFKVGTDTTTTTFYFVADGTEGNDVTVDTNSNNASSFTLNDDGSIQIKGTSGDNAMYLVPNGTAKVKQSKTKQTWTWNKKSLGSSGPNIP